MTLHYEIHGSGKPLVMLHGWAMHSGVWRDFARRLGEHARVICLDLPGHGRSEALTPFEAATVVEALLQAVDAEQFSVLGWSLGATLALEMARRHPQRIDRLLLLAGNPCFVEHSDWPGTPLATLESFIDSLAGDVNQTLARFLALQVNGLAHGKPLLQQLKAALQACPPPSATTLQAGLQILQHSDLRDVLQQLPQPVSVLLGERDRLVPAKLAEHLRQLRPDIDVEVIPALGHAPFLAPGDELLNRVVAWLA